MVHAPIPVPLRRSTAMLLAAAAMLLVILTTAPAAQAALPKLGFYCGGKKDAQGFCQLGVNVYKFKGKTLVTVSTRIPSTDFTCKPSGVKGRGTLVSKVFLGGMPLKATGSFSGKEKPPIGKSTLTVTGKFTSATKIDVTFDKQYVPVGEPGDNCSIKRRINVSLKKQKTNKGLF
jgi:hypothetical protein